MSKRERVAELLDELKSLICDDDNDWSDDDNDWDDKESVDTSDAIWGSGIKWKKYSGALNALVNGKEYRMRLMSVFYEFDENHGLNDILSNEFTWDACKGRELVHTETLSGKLLIEACFTGISGIIYGAVLCSDLGPISYVDLGETVLSGGDMKISSTLEAI
jgi:hypothetical protein